ncbi:hypothetical protein K432DRAFT_452101 [Lepidopterella palustris CBS 459.81]|uniref:Zn(2)-C6 fungal-type domain-containing protein n=1 Tax=Lepidopterella palustris CBS 459.81 TaxID=1314670 RepID=A0A8E2DWI6_9PEZI|nr:hypothetical protein K432DRAFT_452101 [Lepidopterella palustris CBS 459.81]
MPSPCSNCAKNNWFCVLDISSGFCSECIAHGVKCSLVVEEVEFAQVQNAKDRILDKLVDIRVKERRLRKQLALLDARERKLFY